MEELVPNEFISKVISRIVEFRKEKGLSLENMADELELSVSAYNKIEKQETKLTLERLLQIQLLLDVSLNEILGLQGENVYHQNVTEQSTGYQGIQNLHQENTTLTNSYIDSLKEEINFLRGLLSEQINPK